MKISVPKETHPGESRAPMTPDGTGKLVKLGAQVEVEAGLGAAAGFPDELYTKAGATLATERKALVASGDIVLRLRKPPVEEIACLSRVPSMPACSTRLTKRSWSINLPSAA